MIGQEQLLKKIDSEISNDTFPRFCIITGPKGSGKKTLCQYIIGRLHTVGYEVGIKVDEIRAMIYDAYTVSEPIVYLIQDADTMSMSSRNALLKVVEEPPKNAYFIMTLQDLSNTLPTIKSRARAYRMDSYSVSEISEYSVDRYNSAYRDTLKYIRKSCTTPGDVDLLESYNIKAFYDYVNLVVDNIAECEPANAFKSSFKLAIKSDEGYELTIFWKVFMSICFDKLKEDWEKYSIGIKVTSKYLRQVEKLGVNKQQLYDMWVFDIREAWL